MQSSKDLTVLQSLPPGHTQTPLKNTPQHIYTKVAAVWMLLSASHMLPAPFCGFLGQLRKKLSGHGVQRVKLRAGPHYWVGEVCEHGRQVRVQLSLMVLACSKQVIFHISAYLCLRGLTIACPDVLLGSWSSVHPPLLPGAFSLSSCFAWWKIDSGADDKCGTVMTQQSLSWSRAALRNPLNVPVKWVAEQLLGCSVDL